jgi:uncharacterized protein with von Willebrand factor type A (vWA) domain
MRWSRERPTVPTEKRPAEDLPVLFAAALRGAGLVVPPDTVVTFARSLGLLGVDDGEQVYWAGRATLLRTPDDIATYDRVFAEFWGRPGGPVIEVEDVVTRTVGVDGYDEADDDSSREGDDDEVDETLRWSRAEVLRQKDLAECSPDELAEAERLIDSLRLTGARRRSRRRRPSKSGGDLDLRRTVRRAIREGGEPVRLERSEPGERRRRLVLLLDVSGSMSAYARALMRFAHAAVAARDDVEVFALGTRLTRLTAELASHDTDAALRSASAAIPDWEGGTRLGDTVGAFVERWGVRGMARGADVVVLSDGWDRGDPAELGAHMARLAKVAHRVVWVNPLKASPGYAPLAGGMAAALPWVDEFVEGHAVASLEALARILGAGGTRGEDAR